MAIIKVEDIQFFYNLESDQKVIDNISFDAEKGEFLSIIGPSGCGKSTLLRIIAGLQPHRYGKVFYENREIKSPIPEMAFVFQDFALLPWLTNIENVKLGLSLSKMDDDRKEKKAADLLGQFGLKGFENSYPNVLSGGMKQRVGIARAIASNPRVLLMDEPFSSLDELTATTLRADILHLLRSKKISVDCVIMVTHNVEEAVELSDRVVVLSDKPSHVKGIEQIKMKHPRNKHSKQYLSYVDKLDRMLNVGKKQITKFM